MEIVSVVISDEDYKKFLEKTNGITATVIYDFIKRVNSGDIPPEEYRNAGHIK